ncbi:MAG: pyruvate formate lyase activating enzyme [Acidobacteria bacterium]|nr:pyruvate formate lyase activating enzyme [Acidobacteriota bacterium]
MLSRRALLTAAARCVPAGVCLATGERAARVLAWFGPEPSAEALVAPAAPGVRARYWATSAMAGVDCLTCHRPVEQLAGKPHVHDPKRVSCLLCAQGCVIDPGKRGRCRARANVDGELRSLVYGRPVAVHVDPIEKKPFYHFLPGSSAFSLATTGCPLRCRFCQNWELSQASPEDYDVPYVAPGDLARDAERRQARVLAFTYNEPTVFVEYLLDIARAARTRGLRTALVSCGFMNEAPLADMCQALDAIKIDLKGFSEEFYRDVSGASLKPVLRSIRQVAKSGVHLEIVNLVVPTLNDSDRSLQELARWVAGEVGLDVPVHFTRFHPDYQLRNLPPTPVATLERARAIAQEAGLRYAYVGNVPGHPGNDTYCPRCGKAVVRRQSFFVTEVHLSNGRCRFCGEHVAGVW